MKKSLRVASPLAGVGLLAWTAPAGAASNAGAAVHEVFLTFERITQQIGDAVSTALGTDQVSLVVNVLFAAISLGLFVWRFAGFALRGFDMLGLMTLMMTIFFVYLLLTGYQAIFPPIIEASRFVSDTIANAITGREAGMTLAESIFRMLLTIHLEVDCGASMLNSFGAGLLGIPAVIFGYVMLVALGVTATLVELWSLWGFQIAVALGWVTIPFLMVERLSFLFDGWLKFFFGMAVYVIVAKINLALVLLGLQLMFGLAPGVDGRPIPVDSFFDLMGLAAFTVVGIATLYSTGRFAAAIVQGAGGGGIGEMVQKTAQRAAQAVGTVAAAAL